jgi:hypothetical protein
MAKSSGKTGAAKSHDKDVFVGPHGGDGNWQVKREETRERASLPTRRSRPSTSGASTPVRKALNS